MNRGPASLLVALVTLVAIQTSVQPASAGWSTGDMSLQDWGLTIRDTSNPSYSGFTNQPTPANPLFTQTKTVTVNGQPFTYRYVMEDSNDTSNSYSVGPNTGGQNYDSEFMGIGRYGDQVVIGILTGQRPDNGFANFAPGDIKITTDKGVFGVEVGGGIGGTSASNSAVGLGDAGTNYMTASDGRTIGALNSDGTKQANNGISTSALKQATSADNSLAHPLQTAGSIWFNPNWLKDPIANPTTDVQIQFGSGALAGQADSYMYTRNQTDLNSPQWWKADVYQHAIIEIAIPISVFMGAQITQVEWSPSCGNDILVIKNIAMSLSTVPEPASLAMMGIGGLATCVFGARRRRRELAN
ncbi:MAG TPA: PEP-CTERM sorting domain-containing protein [Caulifigura sp.]|jgi:hypothetical protein|nr:PEP-CTERM sorting domain-containing protein [Caulifigura sp.]